MNFISSLQVYSITDTVKHNFFSILESELLAPAMCRYGNMLLTQAYYYYNNNNYYYY